MAGAFSVDLKDAKRLERDLKNFAHRAVPFATKNTLNSAAFTAQKLAREDVRQDLVLRNRFTIQSIQVEQTRTLDIRRQAAVVGSTADYMEDQEFGSIKTKAGKKGVSISTGYSAGQEGQQPRTRLPRKVNQLASIQLKHRRRKGANRRQRNLIAVKDAAASGNKFVYLDLGRRKGIFRVLGGKRNPRVKMVHDLSNTSVRIPSNPWLSPAIDKTEPLMPGIHRKSLEFQLRRLGLFR